MYCEVEMTVSGSGEKETDFREARLDFRDDMQEDGVDEQVALVRSAGLRVQVCCTAGMLRVNFARVAGRGRGRKDAGDSVVVGVEICVDSFGEVTAVFSRSWNFLVPLE